MVSFPNAKINLGLNITEKRTDGFHNLESCFYPVAWQDALEVLPSEKFQFTTSGIEIPGKPDQNLCVRIYKTLQEKYNLPPVHIHLHKNIPIGAGLGGGSSDAAFTIKMLNTLFNLKLSEEMMEDYVRPLGSDCAFFIKNKPVLAVFKGDRFENLQINLSGSFLIIVYPPIHISTREAYEGIQAREPESSIREILLLEKSSWKDHLKNDFETSVFKNHPELSIIKDTLYKRGAIYASMSGSGSSIYGIFEDKGLISQLTFHPSCKVCTSVL